MRRAYVFAIGVLSTAAAVGIAPAHADENSYLADLQAHGVPVMIPASAVSDGYRVCGQIRAGMSPVTAAQTFGLYYNVVGPQIVDIAQHQTVPRHPAMSAGMAFSAENADVGRATGLGSPLMSTATDHAKPASTLARWSVDASKRLRDRFVRGYFGPDSYDRDGMVSVHNHAFMDNPAFQRAYQRGVTAIGGHDKYQFQWRVHVALWAAASAAKLDGDFVECGVNYGFMSSAIMDHLDWDQLGKTFYLLDTFAGLDPRFVSDAERQSGSLEKSQQYLDDGFYVSGVDSVRANFAQWHNQRIIVGTIPETLDQVDTSVAFLHIDMNCAAPEIAALRHFWPRLVPGAFVLLDDYAYSGFGEQHAAMNTLAAELGVTICSLPTGQGLLIKP
jgi:hypothetical protein